MSDINVVTVMGRLVHKPITRNNGTSMGCFTLASNRRYRDKAGVFQEETAFVACKIFGGWTEALTDRQRGDLVIVSGRLRSETWEKDGVKRTELALVCDSVHLVSPSRGSAQHAHEPVPASADQNGQLPLIKRGPPF